MILVTEAAKERFWKITPVVCSGGEVLRLDTLKATAIGEAPGLGVYLAGEPEENDQLAVHTGKPLLWISTAVSAGFDGCIMDLVEAPEGTAFAIGPPEAGREARSQ